MSHHSRAAELVIKFAAKICVQVMCRLVVFLGSIHGSGSRYSLFLNNMFHFHFPGSDANLLNWLAAFIGQRDSVSLQINNTTEQLQTSLRT